MSWQIEDIFPSWGDDGSQPPANKNYQGKEQVLDIHINYLWSSLNDLENEARAALSDIDSDGDGKVDRADNTTAIKNNDIDSDGDGVVDDAADVHAWKSTDLDREFAVVEGGERIASGSTYAIYVDSLADGESMTVTQASLTAVTEPAPSGTALKIVTLASGSSTDRQTILSGDGTTMLTDNTSGVSWTNTTGVEQTTAIVLDNGSGSEQQLYGSAIVTTT